MMARMQVCTVAWFVLAAGCGGGDGLINVTGTVSSVDGSPLKGESSLVVFESTSGGKSASGALNDDGSFEMMTARPGDGMQPGTYKVVLKVWENYRAQTLAIAEAYASAATTPLEATVDADNTHFDFKVEK